MSSAWYLSIERVRLVFAGDLWRRVIVKYK